MIFKEGDMVMYNLLDTGLRTLHYGTVGVVQRRVMHNLYDVKWQSVNGSWYAYVDELKKIRGDGDV